MLPQILAVTLLASPASEYEEAKLAHYRKLQSAKIATLATGIPIFLIGGVVILTGVREVGADTTPRANCTVGKPCGDACIEISDTCHVGTGGGSGSSGPPKEVIMPHLAIGSSMMAVGAGLIIAGIVIHVVSQEWKPRPFVWLTPAGIAGRF